MRTAAEADITKDDRSINFATLCVNISSTCTLA